MGLIVHLQLLQGECCSVPPLLSSEEGFVVQIGVVGHCRVFKGGKFEGMQKHMTDIAKI